jgi:NDP-sugar pyrophosphorylase family protein
VPADRPADFGRDILPQALADGLKLAGYVLSENETVFDLGTPERREKFLRGYAGK